MSNNVHDRIAFWLPWTILTMLFVWSAIDVRMNPPVLYDKHAGKLKSAAGVLATTKDLAELRAQVEKMADDRIRRREADAVVESIRAAGVDIPPLEEAVLYRDVPSRE